MAVIVVLELIEPTDARMIAASGEPAEPTAVRRVHAAPSDPDVPGDPGPTTVCGRETSVMLKEHWEPSGPGQRWWPPRWAGWIVNGICQTCEKGVRAA
ncbi:hypothetical protein [Kitasatospora kifunensis]|uniref:Uncharacterized protein n=1 Tax=Kitasatospora kifunensis TaxID=58351 RepID=A0A7W7RBW1_KITKI|nr:hypothetical protein [Kitasatospora kifunensis]MBB4929122.1 hypothetical protein [Kitasatospora kifunensis]